MSIDSVIPSNHLILCHPLHSLPSIFPASGSFPMILLFILGGQSIEASASVLALPMNTQDWFPLRLTGLISLQSKGLSRVFSSITIRKHQFFGTQPSWWSIFSFSIKWYKNLNKHFGQASNWIIVGGFPEFCLSRLSNFCKPAIPWIKVSILGRHELLPFSWLNTS